MSIDPTFRRSDDSASLADAEIDAYVAKARSSALASMPALSAFQRRMEQYPQLSAAAQLQLVAEYQSGALAAAELEAIRADPRRKTSAIARRRERALADQAKRAVRAEEYLMGANFRLVLLICGENAEKRFGRDRAGEIMGDLVGEANLALVEAVRTYDVARCPVFSTYAARVVRDRVRFVLSKEGAIRLAPAWNRLKRIASVRIPQLAAELGRQPTEAEVKADLLARCMEWANAKLTDVERALPEAQRLDVQVRKLRKQGMLGAIDRLGAVLQASQSVASLDAPVGDGESSSLGDLVSTPSSGASFDDLELNDLRTTLQTALSTLSEREQRIVLLRFGFVDGERWTYAAIGEQFNVTAERIRQIERNVLNKLAGPTTTRDRLAAFLPEIDEDDDLDSRANGRPR